MGGGARAAPVLAINVSYAPESFEHMHEHASDEYEFKTAGCELPAWNLAAVSKFLSRARITGNWWVSFVCMLHRLVPSMEHDQHMLFGTI